MSQRIIIGEIGPKAELSSEAAIRGSRSIGRLGLGAVIRRSLFQCLFRDEGLEL